MSELLVFVGTYTIPEGGVDEFKAANREMGEFVEASQPRAFAWHTYISADEREATTIMIHPDSESLEFHLEVAASRVQRGTQMVRTRHIELYGEPSEALLEQLERISQAAGPFTVTVKPHLTGFSRF